MSQQALLELVVENSWIVDTLRALGGGHILHLSFSDNQIEPGLLSEIKAGQLAPGTLGEILAKGENTRRVATFELREANHFNGFVRFDFRLLSVTPFVRNGLKTNGRQYLCRYRPAAPETP